MAANLPEHQISELFNHADSDLTIRSSDNVLFRVHKRNLETYSPAFAGAGAFPATGLEDIALPESSAVLELMLQYVYLQLQPDLSHTEFEVLAGLAEAVEKYEIYSAMEVCKMHMRSRISPQTAFDVLTYATRHGHANIADEAAIHALHVPTVTMLDALPLYYFRAWVLFQQSWSDIHRRVLAAEDPWHVLNERNGYTSHCRRWARIWSILMCYLRNARVPAELSIGFDKVQSPYELLSDRENMQPDLPRAYHDVPPEPFPDCFFGGDCFDCELQLKRWADMATSEGKTLPKLSSYLVPARTLMAV
ncbi:hypothetical protein PLICRDRAFT_120619 [Plicaturopsis crispa FD-325 SS-3]|nr:hypothetical protein PLICRDRAFT_120619 [Plicaturopsis crispa FD-325 SS-3]